MKKINRLTLVLTLMAAGLFAGCASDEEATRENQKIALDGSHFKFTEVAYQADQAVTRAAASVKPTTVDLGDGLEAEVSVTPDVPTGKTRAVDPISDGKYTILAFDPTTHDLQGKLEGSVTGGVFTPDAGQKLLLDPGTYDFTCFSEPVVYDEPNNRLVVNHFLTKNPMIGHVQATIADDDYEVAFNMEHKAIRVRFNITSDILSENTPIDAYLKGGVPGPWYWMHDWYTAYSGVLNNAGNGDYAADAPLNFKTVAPVTTQAGTTYTSDYVYMLPGIDGHDHISNYPIHFNAGTIGGASLVGKTVGVGTGFQWAINQSITINANVKGQLYLFEDGKARVLAGRGTHTPIGVVLQQKWEPTNQKGIAIALKDAGDATNYATEINSYLLPFKLTNDDYIFKFTIDGYDYTYTTKAYDATLYKQMAQNFSLPVTPQVPASELKTSPTHYLFPAYHEASIYNPGVATQNIGKWFLPSGLQWRKALSALGKIAPTTLDNAYGDNSQNYFFDPSFDPYDTQTFFSMDLSKWSKVFTDASGTFPAGWYNMSSGGSPGNRVHFLLFRPTQVCLLWSQQADQETAHVRPFVYY